MDRRRLHSFTNYIESDGFFIITYWNISLQIRIKSMATLDVK